ncbi:MAG: AsmA family protein [Candidatus Aceula meridiana]|nr:AsmA family protein [Candidatus Aceula meridiana]
MKVLKIILIVFVILVSLVALLIGGGVFFLVKNFDANTLKPQIIEKLETVLGRDVRLKDIALNFSFKDGIDLSLEGFEISDSLQFSNQNLFSVEAVRLGVGILPFLKKREVLVSEISLDSPKIYIVRDTQGFLNILSFDFLKEDKAAQDVFEAKKSAPKPTQDNSIPANVLAALSSLLIRDFEVSNASVSFSDKTEQVGSGAKVENLSLSINDFSLVKPFSFSAKAAIFGDEENFSLSGKTKIDLANLLLYLRDVKIDFDLSKLSAKEFEQISPALEAVGLKDPLQGRLTANIRVAEIGAKGISDLTMDAGIKDATAHVEKLKVPLENINAALEVEDGNVQVDKAGFSLGDGKVFFEGSIRDYTKAQDYKFNLNIDKIDIAKVINQQGQDVKLEGLVSADAQINGKGLVSLVSLRPQAGTNQLTIKDGKLTDINVLKLILSQIDAIPSLAEKLEENLPPKYKEKLQDKDTPLNDVRVKLHIQDNNIYLDEALVESDAFVLKGQGVFDFDLNCKMQARLLIPRDLSKAMAETVKDLNFLVDDTGQIMIPVNISGQIPDGLRYMPDLSYIGQQFLKKRGKQELQKLLKKALGNDEEDEPQARGEGSAPTGGEKSKEPAPEEKLITDILDTIFK